MNKKLGFLAAGLLSLSLMSCSNQAKEVAEEAANSATILTDNYHECHSQLQMISQVTVLIGEEEAVVPVTWESEQFDIMVDEEALVTYATPKNLPGVGAADVDYTLTATATYNGAKATKVFNGKLKETATVEKVTVAQLKEMAIDANKEVIVEGIIRKSFGGMTNAVLTDETGSVIVYSATAIDTFIPGRKVAIRGTRGAHGKYVYKDASKNYITDSEGKNISVEYPELMYTSMEVLEITNAQASLTSAVSTTVADVNKWNTDPTAEGFVNYSGELLKMTCDIVKYDGGSYHVWEACPKGQTKPYVQFYCNSNTSSNMDDLDAYLEPFAGKTVELGLFVYDFNSKISGTAVKNVFRFVPVSVTLAN